MQLHSYQKVATKHLIEKVYTHEGAGLWLDPGLGKTAVTLHAIETLRLTEGVKRTLIVAPLRVILTSWPNEIAKWGFDFSHEIVQGPKRLQALARPADIYLINVENVRWLEGLLKGYWFDLLVIDESTKFKNWSAQCTKSLRRMLPVIPRRITLTGTPVPNNLVDLFPQQFILDRGKTLGTTIGRFREQWCRTCGYEGRQYEVVPSLSHTLLDLVSPYYLRQEAVDHLDMPEVLRHEILVELPKPAMELYKKIEKEMVAEFEGNEAAALTPGSKYNLCRQIASGSFYGEEDVVSVHTAKVDALEDLIGELNGKSLLIGYCFRHEQMALAKRFKKMGFINGDTPAGESVKVLKAFSEGRLQLLAAQCQAMSHGVDGLQKNCSDVCWLSPTDQPEIRQQFEARVYRQGVGSNKVRFHYILANGTVDLKIKRVLDKKDSVQRDVLRSLKG